jgi:Mg-chelatase subunit ChlD
MMTLTLVGPGAAGVAATGSAHVAAAPAAFSEVAACGLTPLDVVIILDNSGSMSENNAGPGGSDQDRAGWAKVAIEGLIADLNANGGVGVSGSTTERHRVGLTKYNGTTATVLSPLGSSAAPVVPSAGSGNTPFKTGMAAGAADLTAKARTTDFGLPVTQVIVFLSDGRPNPDGPSSGWGNGTSQRPTLADATSFLGSADQVFSIAIGSGGSSSATAVDLALMQELDKPSDGAHYANVLSASGLADFFDSIFQTIACPGTLLVKKVVSGGDSSAGTFSIHVKKDGSDVAGSPAAGSTDGTPYSLAAGSYTVSEDAVVNYTGAFSGACNADGVVTVASGQSATCTITNTYTPPEPETGSLNITKKLTGDLTGFTGGDFTFSVTCDDESYGPVTINLSSGSASASPITGIPAGADCTVSETAKPAAGANAAWDAPGYNPSAAVPIVSGQEATVEVTNNRTYSAPSPGYGTIIIEKQTTPEGSSQEFTFSSQLADGTFTLSDGETETFNELRPGTYGVEEVNLPDGWTLASVTGDQGCQLGQPSVLDTAFVADVPQRGNLVSIYVGAGETVRCIFNNRGPEASPTPPPSIQIPRINVEKSASASTVVAGTAVTYTYKVTNTSIDALLTNITVSDDKCSPATYVSGDNDSDTFLQIGETWTYTCTTTLTATTTNTVTASGAWRGQTVTDDAQATVTVTPGAVAGATATPRVTPPPTATASNQDNGNPGSTLGVALAALALFGLVLGALAPKPARARRRSR